MFAWQASVKREWEGGRAWPVWSYCRSGPLLLRSREHKAMFNARYVADHTLLYASFYDDDAIEKK
jgi:hypothetical protein